MGTTDKTINLQTRICTGITFNFLQTRICIGITFDFFAKNPTKYAHWTFGKKQVNYKNGEEY